MKLFGVDFDLSRNLDDSPGPARPAMAAKIGASEGVKFTRVDKYGLVWTIDGVLDLHATCTGYVPTGEVFGNSVADVTSKIDAYADSHAPYFASGGWSTLATYTDKNLGVWIGPEDRYKTALAKWPPPTPADMLAIGDQYASKSFSYGPDVVTLTAKSVIDLNRAIEAYAATHSRPGYGLPTPSAPKPAPAPTPAKPGGDVVTTLPPVTVTPDPTKPGAGVATPSPAVVAASPAAAAPVTGNSGLGALALLVGGVGTVLWAVA